MSRYVIDLETNDLLPTVSVVHCMVLYNVDEQKELIYSTLPTHPDIQEGIDLLRKDCTLGIMHNGIGYDNEVMKKLYDLDLSGKIYDTFIAAQLLLPENLGGHSLNALGQKLGCLKINFEGSWGHCTQDMVTYCAQDVQVTLKLYKFLKLKQKDSEEALQLETDLAPICGHITTSGFQFDMSNAQEFYSFLADKRLKIAQALRARFGCWYMPDGSVLPKKTLRYKEQGRADITAGAPYTRIKLQEFNPNSRTHIIDRLKYLYKWTPLEYTEKGNPKMDDSILAKLPFKEAQALAKYMTIQKRLGQLSDGNMSWFNILTKDNRWKDGRIHGAIKQNGTITGRMSHFAPNLAQIPSINSLYGSECRSLFIAAEKKVLVGIDADGLELRCLAGYSAAYDSGTYIDQVLNGDIHQYHADMIEISRNDAKTFIYALIYGAGNAKLGSVLLGKDTEYRLRAAGKKYRDKLEAKLPALKKIQESLEQDLERQGFFRGLDGRHLVPRNAYSALNTLLQSAGAVLMKKAALILWAKLEKIGAKPGEHFKIVAWVHDEWQIECKPSNADVIGKMAADSIKEAGEFYKFPCPMAGSYKVGANWAETH